MFSLIKILALSMFRIIVLWYINLGVMIHNLNLMKCIVVGYVYDRLFIYNF